MAAVGHCVSHARHCMQSFSRAGSDRFVLEAGVWRISPVVERNGANVDAYAVSYADIPVYSDVCSMNAQFAWGFNGTPDFVSVMFTYNLSFGLKIRVYWQKIHH